MSSGDQLEQLAQDRSIPREWIKAARQFLDDGNREYKGRIIALFESEELAPHWQSIKDKAIEHQQKTNKLPEWAALSELRFGLRSLITIMAGQGGQLPASTKGDLRERRKAIADAARNLAQAMARDPYAADAPVSAILQASGVDLKGDAELAAAIAMTPAADVLRAFAENVDNGARLDVFGRDKAILDGPRIYTGADAQRRQLEQTLTDALEKLTGSPRYSFVAGVLNCLFDTEETAATVKGRCKSRARPEKPQGAGNPEK